MGFRTLLEKLARAEVDFVVVGGVCAVLQGVPTSTFDLDIVHARDEANRERLLSLLQALKARYREHLPRTLTPTEKDLESDGHMLLLTSDGPLDILGTVVGGRTYEDLLARSSVMELGEGLQVHVLDLKALIEIKEEAGREKDLAQLPLLRETLEERGAP